MKKRWLVVMATLLVCAQSAWAVDIKGKWGVGAGLFNRGEEISLIRGHSERTAWLLDARVYQREVATRAEVTGPDLFPFAPRASSEVWVQVGPGLRRYVRANEDFSPYWGASVHSLYSRRHDASGNSFTQAEVGAGAEFNFGVEYFTRWHFSVAAHSGLASLSWTHLDMRQSGGGSEIHETGHAQTASFGFSPSLFVRAYF